MGGGVATTTTTTTNQYDAPQSMRPRDHTLAHPGGQNRATARMARLRGMSVRIVVTYMDI